MTYDIFTQLENSLFGFSGSMAIVALCIFAFFVIAFMFLGLDFKWGLMFSAPALFGMAQMNWFGNLGTWISTSVWILVVGLGIFLLWTWLSDR